jgi:hypothetical protein
MWMKDRAQAAAGAETRFVPFARQARPSRGGQEVLRFSEDGRFEMFFAGPDDRPRAYSGTWSGAGERSATLRFDGEPLEATVTLENTGALTLSVTDAKGTSTK